MFHPRFEAGQSMISINGVTGRKTRYLSALETGNIEKNEGPSTRNMYGGGVERTPNARSS